MKKKITKKKSTAVKVVKDVVKNKLKAIAAAKKQRTVNLANPEAVMAFGKILKKFIQDNGLSVTIGKGDSANQYAMVDGWKFAAMNCNLKWMPSKPMPMHKPGEYIKILYHMVQYDGKNGKYSKEHAFFVGFAHDTTAIDDARLSGDKISREVTRVYFAYDCECILTNRTTGEIEMRGTGICSNLELLKSGFDGYSVSSMSETRAIGKAIRNLLGQIMKAAGYEGTPAEEMTAALHDTPFTVVEEKKGTPIAPDKFKALMAEVIAGKISVETIRKEYTLDDEQTESLEIAEKSKK